VDFIQLRFWDDTIPDHPICVMAIKSACPDRQISSI
jgi:hypothetical protein